MQEVTGSSPVSPTNHPLHAQSDRLSLDLSRPEHSAQAEMLDMHIRPSAVLPSVWD
jgi:hypothetical protein